jgi:hypothetical protein
MSHLTKDEFTKAANWVFNESKLNINKKTWNTKNVKRKGKGFDEGSWREWHIRQKKKRGK